jgi:hypothetical protein
MSGISRIKSPLNQALGLSEWGERLIIPGSMEDEVIETNQVFQPNAINGSKIESLTVNKLRAGSLNVDEYLQSTGYVAGSTGWRINGDGSVEFDSGYFRGDITGATGTFSGSITAGSIDIPDTTTSNSFHVETDGDTFWGTTPALFTSNNDNATSYILKTGAARFSSVKITGLTAGSSLDGQYFLANSVASASAKLALRGWTQTCTFTVTDADTVAWGSGTLTASDGTAYSISSGNTGNMAAKTYIYLDIAVSTTAYQTTTTATTAVGDGKLLVAIAQNNTTEATYFLLNNNSYNIDAANIVAGSITTNEIAAATITAGNIAALTITASQIAASTITSAKIAAGTITASNIAAGTITANEIAASTITAGKLSISTLSAITADLGTITAGNITLNTSGYIRGGQTAYDTGTGFFLGYDTSAYKFSVGNSAGDKLTWNGTTLSIAGSLTATAGAIGGWTINSTSIYTGTEDHSGYTANAGDMTLYSNGSDASIHANKFYIDSAGVLNCTAAVISGAITASAGSVIDGTYLSGASVTASKAVLALVNWTQTCTFSVTDADTVAWSSGTLTLADGTAYSISSGNTGNMAAKTYIYLDVDVSITAYQTTTTAATAVGDNKILLAIAQNGTTEATFMLLNNNSYNIDAANIVAGSITANEIAAGAITATKISVSNLSAINADLGSITAGTITLNTSGYIRGGQTAYATGTGFFLGYDTSAYKLSIGDSSQYINWDGSSLTSTNANIVNSYVAGEDITAGDALIVSTLEKTTYLISQTTDTNEISDQEAPPNGGIAQTFTTGADDQQTVVNVIINVKRIGNPGDMTVAIYATAAGIPTGASLYSTTISEASISTSAFADYTATINGILSSSTVYAVVFSAPSSDGSNCYRYIGNSAGGYANGVAYLRSLGVWSTPAGGSITDLHFQINMAQFSTASGPRVLKTEADSSYSYRYNNFIGFAMETISNGGNVRVYLSGAANSLTGLTVGSVYYLSNTPGLIGTSAGSNSVKVGRAIKTTSLLIQLPPL